MHEKKKTNKIYWQRRVYQERWNLKNHRKEENNGDAPRLAANSRGVKNRQKNKKKMGRASRAHADVR